jgi:hypothetical protein
MAPPEQPAKASSGLLDRLRALEQANSELTIKLDSWFKEKSNLLDRLSALSDLRAERERCLKEKSEAHARLDDAEQTIRELTTERDQARTQLHAAGEANRKLSAERGTSLDGLAVTSARLTSLQESNARLTTRYNRSLVDLDDALAEQSQLASALNKARAGEADNEHLLAHLKQQLDGLAAELERLRPSAIRYDTLVHRLRAPDGPRAVRMVLPLARLLRSASRILGAGPEPPAARNEVTATHLATTAIPHGEIVGSPTNTGAIAVRQGFGKRIFRSVYLLIGRPIIRPVAWRTRAFMLASIKPADQQIEMMTREIVALRQEISSIAIRGSDVSPELVKSIEALILTLAVCTPRD